MAIAEEKMRRGVVPFVNHQFFTPPPAVPGTAVGPATYQPNFTMGANPAPAAPAPGAIDVRPKYNPANGSPEAKAWMASQQPAATPQAPGAPAAPAPQAAAPAQPKGPGAVNRMNAAFTNMTGMGGDPSRATAAVGRTGAKVVKAAGRVAAPLGVVNEAVDVGKVAVDPNASGIDVATQASQGAARLASAGVGAAAGAAAGSVIPVVGTAIGGIAGGLLGYYGANKAIEAGRSAVGVDPRSPAERAPSLVTPAAAAPVPAAAPAPGAIPAKPAATVATVATPAAPVQEAVIPAGAIRREGNSYSGTNVSGPVTFTDGAGKPVAARGGYASLDTSQGYAQDLKEIAAGAGTVSPALTAARDAAIKRGDIDAVRASYGGNFMGKTAADAPIDALMNNGRPMTAKKAGAIAQLQAQKDGTIQAGATRKLAQDKFALEATGATLDNTAKKQIQDAQNKVVNAKTDAERLTATETLRALQGKYEKEMPNRYTVVPGGQAVDPATQQLVREPSQVLDNQTGQFINAAPARPAQNFTKGQTYTDAKGNKATWDGQQFVAAK